MQGVIGNVWEFVWDAGKEYKEKERVGYAGSHVVFGGDFNYPAVIGNASVTGN